MFKNKFLLYPNKRDEPKFIFTMEKQSFSEKIILSITGENNIDWQAKLDEINRLKITEVAVFLERFDRKERDHFYRFLLRSSVKKIPFVHLREDVSKEEIQFFINKFRTKYFNIHEDHFKSLDRWKGFWDKLYLEMNYDSKIAKEVKVRRIGGFCVDLAHFKAAIARGAKEAYYIHLRKDKIKFACNHLGGYCPERMKDVHKATGTKDFDYLTTLPKYIFGKVIALEVDNGIREQIAFKKHISRILDNYFYQTVTRKFQ